MTLFEALAKLQNFPDEASAQRWLRIMLSLAAYGYEKGDCSPFDDATYDALCKEVNPSIQTGRPILDWFFMTEFQSDTSLWVHKHPELDKLQSTFNRMRNLWTLS